MMGVDMGGQNVKRAQLQPSGIICNDGEKRKANGTNG